MKILFFFGISFLLVLPVGSQPVSKSYYSSYALCNGTIQSWGNNNQGQLGDGSYADSYAPVQVAGLGNVVAVSGGDFHALALKSDSSVWTWGANTSGVLGVSSVTNSPIALQVNSLSRIIAVDGGAYFSMALKRDGSVWTWGNNLVGQLGDGTAGPADHPVPLQVSNLDSVKAISAGNEQAVALRLDGSVWVWGYMRHDYVTNYPYFSSHTAVKVPGLSNIIEISAGNQHCLALKADGTVWAWGSNQSGQLGNNGNTTFTPVPVASLNGIIHVAAGQYHSLALRNDGTVWKWGWDQAANAGNTMPAQVSGLNAITSIAAGHHSSLAADNKTGVWAWGMNDFGQLGNGNTIKNNTPAVVAGACAMSPLSIRRSYREDAFSLHPNPSKGLVHFKMQENYGTTSVEVYDLLGEIVFISNLDPGQESIDFRAQAPGIYLCHLIRNGQSAGVRKLVIE